VTTRAKRSRAFRGGAAGNAHPVASRRHAGPDPARDAEGSRTLLTGLYALAGVWIAVGMVVAVLVAVALIVYLTTRG
jgi:hypothetical protein